MQAAGRGDAACLVRMALSGRGVRCYASRMANSHRAAPHPFPYQGSKRSICRHILPHIPAGADRYFEQPKE